MDERIAEGPWTVYVLVTWFIVTGIWSLLAALLLVALGLVIGATNVLTNDDGVGCRPGDNFCATPAGATN